jgi:hypothetical protein
MTTRSASSITPFLIACRSSPALGSCISTNSRSCRPRPSRSGRRRRSRRSPRRSRPPRRPASTRASSRPRRPACRCRAGPDVGRLGSTDRRSMRVLSPRIEPPDAGRGVDRQHRHAVAPAREEQAQGLDEGALAHPRHAADAQAQRAAGVCGSSALSSASARARWSARVDSGDAPVEQRREQQTGAALDGLGAAALPRRSSASAAEKAGSASSCAPSTPGKRPAAGRSRHGSGRGTRRPLA